MDQTFPEEDLNNYDIIIQKYAMGLAMGCEYEDPESTAAEHSTRGSKLSNP